MFRLSARPPSVALLKLRTVNWDTAGGNLEGWKDATLGKTTGKVSRASFGQRVLMKAVSHCRAGTLGEARTVITQHPAGRRRGSLSKYPVLMAGRNFRWRIWNWEVTLCCFQPGALMWFWLQRRGSGDSSDPHQVSWGQPSFLCYSHLDQPPPPGRTW